MGCAIVACARAPTSEPVSTPVQRSQPQPSTPVSAVPSTVLLEEGFTTPWAPATPEEVHLRREALGALIASAAATDSDALLVIRGDRTVVARAFGHAQQPLELMSVTKGFGALAIGFLVDEGKITSLDTPMSMWLPEWKKDAKKSRVTLRHVLTHTSGLAHKRFAKELMNQRDRVAYVRALPLETEPGQVFSYSNEATQLLSVVITSAAGEPIDSYLRRRLFEPLGIERFDWARDQAGNAAISWGLALSAVDLAKVGVMLRDGGSYRGKRVVAETWTREMLAPTDVAKWHGLLTWLVYDGPWQVQTPERRNRLAAEGFLAARDLSPLDGVKFASRAAYWMAAGALLDERERAALGAIVRDDLLPFENVDGSLVGWNFNGWLGQYLVVYPQAGLVAVRQRREPPNVRDEDNDRIGMKRFPELVRAALP